MCLVVVLQRTGIVHTLGRSFLQSLCEADGTPRLISDDIQALLIVKPNHFKTTWSKGVGKCSQALRIRVYISGLTK